MFNKDTFLSDAGLSDMPKAQQDDLLQYVYDELELRVGTRLSENMSEQQLVEFEKLVTANNEAGAREWLQKNSPEYPKIVAEEIDKLKAEIASNKDKILAGEAA